MQTKVTIPGSTGLHESIDREALFSRKIISFFLWNAKVDVLTKRCELKYMSRFHFVSAIDCITVFSCIIQCCELRQFWSSSAEQNVASRAFYIAKQSSKYWQNNRGSNCLTKFSLCRNYDSFIPLSFIHFGIQYNLKSTRQQTGEIFCIIEILFSLKYSRMVLMVVCCRYRMPFDANGCVSTLMNVTFYPKKKVNWKWQKR